MVTIMIIAWIKGGGQDEEAQEEASQVEKDDDGEPIQPQRQVSHLRVHQSLQRDHLKCRKF